MLAFQDALQSGSTELKIYNNLGLSLAKLGRYQEAYDAFRKGANAPKAYNNLGVVLLEAGQSQKAAVCFRKAIETNASYYEKANENLRAIEHTGAKGTWGKSQSDVACP